MFVYQPYSSEITNLTACLFKLHRMILCRVAESVTELRYTCDTYGGLLLSCNRPPIVGFSSLLLWISKRSTDRKKIHGPPKAMDIGDGNF